ncbi:DUF2778 domain-containing protein [Rhizobium sp.]
MASQSKSAHRAPKSSRGRSFGIVLSAFLSCGIIAGASWGVASVLGAMQAAAHTLSENMAVATPRPDRVKLGAKVAAAEGHRLPPLSRSAKTTRLVPPSDTGSRRRTLTAAAIRKAHQQSVALRELALAEKNRKAEKAAILAAFARPKSAVKSVETTSDNSSLVTALVEDVPVRSLQPFGLVLAKPDTGEDLALLPSKVPLPEARPLLDTVVVDPKPSDEKPLARDKTSGQDDAKDVAYAKPERSLFGDLFKNKGGDAAWPGKGTKVAIYDVSNATVYMPDGTRLRAHSGIGRMRDNPRYEHVKMTGPTPAGIYRLSMREKRFYGVEAIRMTSIDGRDPKNRTGLLTHTNLLRNQKGSHGCVAFQDYQPFLRAFKRGQITMLVVVPELPSSNRQLAALYRKAGA